MLGTDGTFPLTISRRPATRNPETFRLSTCFPCFPLFPDAEKSVYLELLQKYLRLYSVALVGYCLMSNHVHLIAEPLSPMFLVQAYVTGVFIVTINAVRTLGAHRWTSHGNRSTRPAVMPAEVRVGSLRACRPRGVAADNDGRSGTQPPTNSCG